MFQALLAPLLAFVPGSNLTAVLDSVRAESIKSDVYFLADDELGGRDTPSEELKVAARFLRARLERLGWKPGASDGYFYTYPLEHKKPDESASKLVLEAQGKSQTLRFASDYFFASPADARESTTSASIVFCGSGERDDFKAATNVAGSWALVFAGEDEPRDIARRARDAKAAGVLYAAGPQYSGKPFDERFADALTRMRTGSVSPVQKQKERDAAKDGAKPLDEGAPRERIATVCLARAATETLLALAGVSETPAVGAALSVRASEERRLVGDGGKIQVENVCGLWPGSDPVLGKEVILVSAHYDHVGTRNGVVYNGADDNGSGTSTLLAVAEALTQAGPLRRTVMLMWVSGEEKGLWGSRAWADAPWLPEGCKAIANINIDMVGRNAPDKLLITPTKKREKDYNGLVKLAESVAPLEGFPVLGSADQYYERSDHYMFARLGIPVMFLFSDVHEDYHRPGDDPEKLDYDKIRRVSRLVLRILDGLQADELELR